MGYKAVAVTDRNTMAGIVRAHAATKGKSIRLIPACRLDLLDGPSLLVYPTDKAACGRLCALLSKGNLRAEKGECHLYVKDVFEHKERMKFILIPPGHLNRRFEFNPDFVSPLTRYKLALGSQLYLGTHRNYQDMT
jgi:error-prone DNA polymerase